MLGEGADEVGLLPGQPVGAQGMLDQQRVHGRGGQVVEPVGGGQGVLLDFEQVPGGPAWLLAGVEGDRVGVGQHPGGQPLHCRGVDQRAGRQVGAHGLEEVVEPGALLDQPGRAEQPLGQGVIVRRRRGRLPERLGDNGVGVDLGRGGLRPPAPLQLLRVDVGLEVAAGQARGLRGPRPLQARPVQLVGDRVGAFREHPAQPRRDARYLRRAAGDRPPADAEAGGELGAQHGLVEMPGGAGVPVGGLGVQRRPAPVAGAGEVGEHDVGVQLRVQRAGHIVGERDPDQPVAAHPGHHLPVPVVATRSTRDPRLEPPDRLGDGGVVGGAHLLGDGAWCECGEQGHRLRGGEGQVQPGPAAVHP